MLTDRSHEQYARLFIYQRIKDVYNTLNKTGDGEVDCEELQEYLTYLNFKATKKQVHDMVWEVDDSSEGVIRLDTIRALLTRMQKAKNRGVGTGSNLLRTLIEYMMFDTDGSGGIEIEEVQQMFFIYYGYKGQQLDLKIKDFQRLRRDATKQIEFGEFLELMDKLDLKVAVQEDKEPPPPRKPLVPSPVAKPPTARSPRRLPAPGGARTSRLSPPTRGGRGNATSRSGRPDRGTGGPPPTGAKPGSITARVATSRPGTRGSVVEHDGLPGPDAEGFLPPLRSPSVATNNLFTFCTWQSSEDPSREIKEVMGVATPHEKKKERVLGEMQERRFLHKSRCFMKDYTKELKTKQAKADKAKEFSEPKMIISNALIKR